jgi:CHAT domain
MVWPRAFRTAGARHMLVATRGVPDRDARLFMQRFYTHLFVQPFCGPGGSVRGDDP